jgi:hypothetical protein
VQLGATTRVGVLIGSTGDFQPITVAQGISEERWRAVWLSFRLVAAALAIVIVRSVERLQRAAATVAAQPAAPAPVEPAPPEGGPALPPPPPTTPTVQDAVTSGERMLVIAVVIGAVALTIGGQLWVGGTRSGSSGVPPSSSSLTPVPVGGTTYEQNGVRFTYPPGWTEGPTSTSGSVGAPPLWTDGFSPPSGSSYDIVIVSAYNLGDAGSLDPSRQQTLVKNLTNALLSSLHGSLTADVAPVAIGPETGYHSLMSVTLQGVPVAVDFNVLFHGSTEYTIVCQSTSSATDEVAAGCGQIRSTFQIVG